MEQQNILWVDLEMTGLNIATDHIVEIAALITDPTATKELSPLFHRIPFQSDEILSLMGPWVKEQHTKTGLVDLIKQSKVSVQEIDTQLAHLINNYGPKSSFILAGNSIWQDRLFIQKYMPLTYAYLHYRMIDVTTIKQMVRAWYKDHPQAFFIKNEAHRAADDVRASINELFHYKKNFFTG